MWSPRGRLGVGQIVTAGIAPSRVGYLASLVTSPISRRLAAITDSATLAVSARAAAMRAAGRPVIGFAVGEPDFPTPDHIIEAAQRAAANPRSHHYSPAAGLPELREAVVRKSQRDSGLECAVGNVTITVGAKGAVYGACVALLDEGDEVLVPAPYWVSYPDIVSLAGGVVRTVPATLASGYRVSVDDLEAARTPRTKMLIFCSPNNPSGAVYPRDEVIAIGRWAAHHGIWVLTDEIYEHLVYGDAVFSSMPVVAPETRERCIVVNSVAKTYAMTGWRVGWMVGPPEVAAAVGRLQSHSTSNVTNVSQFAALAALEGSMDSVWQMRVAFDRRRRLMRDLLQAIPGVDAPQPEGAFYFFPGVDPQLALPGRGARTALEVAQILLEAAEIAVVPGEAFGAPGSLRLSFALGDDDLVEGLQRWLALTGG
ncbi:MAG: pyridoxal phosphate-dependent aminotransferase [Acidimicrobiia bacterium]|nr:pyridoxal phosphate-dependent aminotransferase [Acidimicrobiia bacterium]